MVTHFKATERYLPYGITTLLAIRLTLHKLTPAKQAG